MFNLKGYMLTICFNEIYHYLFGFRLYPVHLLYPCKFKLRA